MAIATSIGGLKADTDGVMGVLAMKKHGGIVIAQNESSCRCSDMPKVAIATRIDFILPPP